MQAQHLLEEIFYNARVQGFGGRVRKLRVERKLQMTDVARAAITSATATAEDVRDFANYLSKIELEKPEACNPSLELLEQIAKGMGLRLSQFFLQIERQTDGDLPAGAVSDHDAATSPSRRGVSGGQSPSVSVRPDVREAVSRALFLAAQSLVDADAAPADERPDRQVRAARAAKRRPR
jgi:transcriptional regulator with XRE-family HTH domain